MKKLLWRPSKISWQIHILIALTAVIGITLVENMKIEKRQADYELKLQAAKTMEKGMQTIKKYRRKNIGPVNKSIDPLQSGMMGINASSVTNVRGDYHAKLSTHNPNWAAVIITMLRKAKVKEKSTICTAFSGSFPSLNLAVLSAAKAMQLKVVIISSASASTWGANIPGLLWLDMERVLYEKKIIPYTSVAASIGGLNDIGTGMSEKGIDILTNTIKRNNIILIDNANTNENINRRMEIYSEYAGNKKISAFINCGGGTITVGTSLGKKKYNPGLNLRPSKKAMRIDSVMTRFAKKKVPIIHLSQVRQIAEQYGIPIDFKRIPKPGRGKIFIREDYNNKIVIITLVIILLLLFFLIKEGKGHNLFTSHFKPKRNQLPPEHMV